MKLTRLLPLVLPAVFSCGGGDFGSGFEGEFNTVILYTAGTDPAFLESDAVQWATVKVSVNARDPNTGDCTAAVSVDLCISPTFKTDPVTINFILEPKKDYQGKNFVQVPSPVLLQEATIKLTPITVGCPSYSFTQSLNFTLQPIGTEEVQGVPISVVPHTLKEDIYTRLSSAWSFTYVGDDGCPTPVSLWILNTTCEYKADISIKATELYSGDTETINISLTLRVTDYKTEDECMPGG